MNLIPKVRVFGTLGLNLSVKNCCTFSDKWQRDLTRQKNLHWVLRKSCFHSCKALSCHVERNFEDKSGEDSNHASSYTVERLVGTSEDSQEMRLLLKPDSPPNAHHLHVAVIGRPNCGKSTLTNILMGWRVTSVSEKVHTTRKNTLALFTYENKQIVFLDTPGILQPGSRKRHKLEKSMEIDPARALSEADLVVAMVDASCRYSVQALDPNLLELLALYHHIPSILVLNKIDLVKKKNSLLPTVRVLTDGVIDGKRLDQSRRQSRKMDMFDAADRRSGSNEDFETIQIERLKTEVNDNFTTAIMLELPPFPTQGEQSLDKNIHLIKKAVKGRRGWPLFQEVFVISSVKQTGVGQLKDYILSQTKPGEWKYHSSLVTDQSPDNIVLMCVREKLLDYLKNEVPYQLNLSIVLLEVDKEDGLLNVIVNIYCNTERQLTIFLGSGGQMIHKISSQAKQSMMNTFRCDVRLKLVAILKSSKRR